MIVGVMRKLCVWVDCNSPEALAANAAMVAVGRSASLKWDQRMCVSCTAYACIEVGSSELVRNESVNGYPNLSDLLGRATALAGGAHFRSKAIYYYKTCLL